MVENRYPTGLRLVSGGLLSFSVLFPHLLGLIGLPLRVSAVGIGLAALAVELYLGPWSRRKSAIWLAGAALWCIGGLGVIELGARALDNRLFAVNSAHLFVLLPLFGAVGVLIYRSEGARIYLLTFLVFASVDAGLAIAEALLDHSLLGREPQFLHSQREGLTRALVGSEDVLTLGATLAATVPLTLKLGSLRFRLMVSALLVAGCWASGSRAPAVLCTAVALTQFVPYVRNLFQRHLWIMFSGATAVLLGIAYMSVFVWTPWIAGSTGLQYSANYRGAMYSLVPQILGSHPLGYLLSGPPLGVWTVGSQLHGAVDIAMSSDSEIVFAVFGLGWIGIALYIAALFTSVGAIKSDVSVGLAALSLTVLGLTLALHSWDGMSPLWYSLIGISAYMVFSRARLRYQKADRRRPSRPRKLEHRPQSHYGIQPADR